MSEPAQAPPPATVEPVSIVQALNQVMAIVEAVGKTGHNKQQNFNYRGIDAVVNAVGPAFRQCGVTCIPIDAGYDAEHYQAKGGANMRGITIRVKWRFYGPAGDYIEAMSIGEAADAGDKAVSKAHSVAYRTVLLQTLCIPTGDEDPDATSHERETVRREGPPPTPLPKGWAELEQLIRGADNPDEAWPLFQAFVRAASFHLYGKTDSTELEQDQKDVLWQKAVGAGAWLVENVTYEGPFRFYDEAKQRLAWQHILNTSDPLPIPDYVPPEPPLDEKAEAEAEALAAEVFAEEVAAKPEEPADEPPDSSYGD